MKKDILSINVLNDQQLQVLLSHQLIPLKLLPIYVDVLKFVNAILQNPLDEDVYYKPLSNGTYHPASTEGTVSDLHNS